jgi:hypothetical protein
MRLPQIHVFLHVFKWRGGSGDSALSVASMQHMWWDGFCTAEMLQQCSALAARFGA